MGTYSPTGSSGSPTGFRSPTPTPLRTQHGPRGPRRCFENTKEQVGNLLLVVEVGRLELPSRGVGPGILRAQPPVEVRTRAVRWRRSRVLASLRCSWGGRWRPASGEPAIDARPAPTGKERRTAV